MNLTDAPAVGEVEALIQKGRAARQQGDGLASISAFEAAASIDPKHPGVKADLALALRLLDRLDEAEAVCREALGIDPHHADAMIELGHIARQRGDRLAAFEAFKAAAIAHPSSAHPKVEATSELRELGRPDEAERFCQEALAIEPDNVAALAELGLLERGRGDRAAALAAFERAMAAQPNHVALMTHAAADLRALGRSNEAEQLCKQALALDPQDVGCLAELGHIAHDRGDFGAALAAFSTASAAKPDHMGLRARVVLELRELGRLDEAEKFCRDSLSVDPAHVACLAELGHIARRRGDHSAAADAYQSAISLHPNNAGLKTDLALALRLLGKLDEAEASCRAAIVTDSHHVEAFAQLGQIARQRGDRLAASEAFKAAAAARPDRIDLKIEAASDLRELGRIEEAESLSQESLAIEPDNIGALLELGLIARSRGDYAAALARFERAMAVRPNHIGLMTNAVADLRALGRSDEAEQLCKEALAIDPRDVGCLAQMGHIAHDRSDHSAALAAFSAASAVMPDHMGLRAQVIVELRKLGKLEEAEKFCRDSLEIDPRHVTCLAELGHIARQRGDHASSLAAFRSALNSHPEDIGLKLQEAFDLRELGRLEEAEICCRDALKLAPTRAEPFAEYGQIARRRGDHETALGLFKAASKKSPRNLQYRIDVAAELRALERFEDAVIVLRQALELDPRHTTILSWIGQISARQGNIADAVAAFEAALLGDFDDSGTALDLTTALCELGSTAKAATTFEDKLVRDAHSLSALLALGVIRLAQYRLDEANDLFHRAAEQAPQEFACWLCLGRLARLRGAPEEALAHFQQARALRPSHVGCAIEVACQLRDLGEYEQARSVLEAALAKYPSEFELLMHMGHLYRTQGRRDLALTTFEAAQRRQPQHPRPLVDIAVERRALGDPRESERLLYQALALAPRDQTALEVLADHHLEAEDFEEALALSRQAIALFPHKFTPYLRASRAALELGDAAEAQKLLHQAEERAGPYPEITAMRASNYMWERDWATARDVLLTANPDCRRQFCLWTVAARLAIVQGDYEAAKAELPASPISVSERAQVELLRGQIAEGQWELQTAADFYRAALALTPHDPEAHFDLARVSLKLLDVDACRHHLKRQVSLMSSHLLLRGQSRNASQTHVGQLLDEFLLDQELLQTLREVRSLSSREQIEPLERLALSHPFHTPTAITLLIAMRECGLLVHDSHASPSGAFINIPQKILQYWDDADVPSEILALMNSWRDAHPDFEYVRLDHTAAERFLQSNNMFDVLRAYRRAREPAQRADLLRLAYLGVNGGFYADADDRCLAPLWTFVPSHASFVAFQEDYGTLANNFLGVAPNHPVIRSALQLGAEAINRGDNDFLWLATGPGLLSRAFVQFICQRTPEGFGTSTVLDMAYTAKRVGFHCPVTYKKTERHWSRTSFGKRKKAI